MSCTRRLILKRYSIETLAYFLSNLIQLSHQFSFTQPYIYSNTCNQDPLCLNCDGKHSAAFHGCKVKPLLKSAYKIKASQYMSFTDALKIAKTETRDSEAETRETETLKSKQMTMSYAQAISRGSIQPQSFPDFVRQSVIPVVKALGNKDTSSATSGLFSIYKSTHTGIEADEGSIHGWNSYDG